MDLISLHQHGITNVVASLGTALTINQARLLKRYADKVVTSFEWLNDLPGNVLKSVVDFSYDIEEIIRIYVENKN